MDKEQKKKYLEMLRESDLFSQALKSAKNDAERQKVKAFSEDVFINLVEGLEVMKKIIEENPEKVAEAAAKHIPKE